MVHSAERFAVSGAPLRRTIATDQRHSPTPSAAPPAALLTIPCYPRSVTYRPACPDDGCRSDCPFIAVEVTALTFGGDILWVQMVDLLARLLQVKIQHPLGDDRRDDVVSVVAHIPQRFPYEALPQPLEIGPPQHETVTADSGEILDQLAMPG